jgi:hypothetical protein
MVQHADANKPHTWRSTWLQQTHVPAAQSICSGQHAGFFCWSTSCMRLDSAHLQLAAICSLLPGCGIFSLLMHLASSLLPNERVCSVLIIRCATSRPARHHAGVTFITPCLALPGTYITLYRQGSVSYSRYLNGGFLPGDDGDSLMARILLYSCPKNSTGCSIFDHSN